MKPALAFAVILPMLGVLPGHGIAASMTYGAVDVLPGTTVDIRRQVAEQECTAEAATPPRGTSRTGSFYHQAAFRACLYRKGFFGTANRAYPVPLFGSHMVGG